MVLSLERWVGKVAVVTGASSGIGASIAETLVRKGVNVAGLARRQERLEELAKRLEGTKAKLYSVKTDISKEEDILNAFKWIKNNLGPVHILVNNAGIGSRSNLVVGDTLQWELALKVNVLGLCIATREGVKDMKANNVDGHIIHINSIEGSQVLDIPRMNILYPASKFAVRALAETLRLELNALKSKIKITNLSPGFVNTEIIPSVYRKTPKFKKLLEAKYFLDPEDIADAAVYALSTPPHVQIQQLTVRGVLEDFSII